MPLITPTGQAVGTLCAVDFKENTLTGSQKESIRRLSRQVVAQLELRRVVTEMDTLIKSHEKMNEELNQEKERADKLLLNILPKKIATELKETNKVDPKFYANSTILFSDFCGFTKLSENMEPKSLIELLNQNFSAFDDIVATHGGEKLKTIGDSYMCASGLPNENRGHALQMALISINMIEYLKKTNIQREKLRMKKWEMRIGINTGSVMAGVVGKNKFTYDIWGDAVNSASLLETFSEPGMINISESTHEFVSEAFETEDRGKINTGKKGEIQMYYLKRLKPEFSSDDNGFRTNEEFNKKFGKFN
jgi:Adenylate cyclase, family 3 (some proteins contain HAMP domain)